MSFMNFSVEEELPIILLKEYEPYKRLSYLYDEMESNAWRISQGSIRTRNSPWQILNCSQKSDVVVGHSSNEKTGRFPKYISFFLRGGNENSCRVEVTGKSKPWRWERTPNILQTAF